MSTWPAISPISRVNMKCRTKARSPEGITSSSGCRITMPGESIARCGGSEIAPHSRILEHRLHLLVEARDRLREACRGEFIRRRTANRCGINLQDQGRARGALRERKRT